MSDNVLPLLPEWNEQLSLPPAYEEYIKQKDEGKTQKTDEDKTQQTDELVAPVELQEE